MTLLNAGIHWMLNLPNIRPTGLDTEFYIRSDIRPGLIPNSLPDRTSVQAWYQILYPAGYPVHSNPRGVWIGFLSPHGGGEGVSTVAEAHCSEKTFGILKPRSWYVYLACFDTFFFNFIEQYQLNILFIAYIIWCKFAVNYVTNRTP